MDNYTPSFDKNKEQFLIWEAATRDTIDFKKMYVDIADDLVAGILLSQIVFWHLPNKQGASKLRVKKDGYDWLVRGRDDWWDECRISPRQYDTAIKKLIERGVIVTKVYKFNGETKIHIRIVWETFFDLQNKILNPAETVDTHGNHESVIVDLHGSFEKAESRIGESGVTQSVNPINRDSNRDKDMDGWMDESDPDIPILKILRTKLKRLKNNGTTVADEYLPPIFSMLHERFPHDLNPETVSEACDLFLDGFVKEVNKDSKFRLDNVVGWFHEQYKKAIKSNKAKTFLVE